jgi:multimeric flavodoxin WrbA
MKVVAINGSPNPKGNTATLLKLMAEELDKEGIETQIIQVGGKLIHGCKGCGFCRKPENDRCVINDDIVNEVSQKMREADGIILGSPTYFGNIPGTMKSFLDRDFYSGAKYMRYKVGTAVSIVRRAGGADVYRQLRNYFDLMEVLTPPSQYWMGAYGMGPGEVLQDAEGIQTVKKNARAMAWLLKIVVSGKERYPIPQAETKVSINFII